MNASIILFCAVMMVYVILIDIFTVLFRLTGLSKEKAKFQVVSLLTNSGFTTKESEFVVETPFRRRLARVIMFFGYAFSITIVSSMVNLFMSFDRNEISTSYKLIIILGVFFVLFMLVRRIKAFRMATDIWLTKIGYKIFFSAKTNPIIVLDEFGERILANITLNKLPEKLHGAPLLRSGLKENYGIQVLLIRISDGTYVPATAATILEEGSTVTVMGTFKHIKNVFGQNNDI